MSNSRPPPRSGSLQERREASDDIETRAAPDIKSSAAPAADIATAINELLDVTLGGIFDQMEWAEEELDAACVRHPERADRLFHSFSLLHPHPALERMQMEFIYRSHCRELLDRVAIGEDTRPGTAAEICCAMCETTRLAPVTSAAAGLYMRMWQAAGFPALDEFAAAGGHHEALEQTTINDHEAFARRTLAVADRRLGDIECRGRHRGVEVNCSYMRGGQLNMDV